MARQYPIKRLVHICQLRFDVSHSIMGVLRLSTFTDSKFESEVIEGSAIKEDAYLVRPCERYKELYKSCKSIRGRMHQYYVYGELFDCSEHKRHFKSCLSYRKTNDIDLLKPIIQWEKKMIETRLKACLENPVWEVRDSPPKDFNDPLPDFIQKRKSWSKLKAKDRV